MEFMIRHNGREIGPYSEAEVRTRLISGAIAPLDLARLETAADWKPLSTLGPFAPGGPPIPPPLPSVLRPDAINTNTPLPTLDSTSLGSYTRATLQPNERPLHLTTIHWMVLIAPLLGALLSLIVIVPIAMVASWKGYYFMWILLGVPALMIASAAIGVKTSELVITDRRVLIKVGFIRRQTFEMFISKIESVSVSQGMIGKMLDFGTVEIRGTGGSSESFGTIAAPLQFRDAIQLVQSDSERR